MNKFTIRAADDFHVHFRQGANLSSYVRDTAQSCERALVMPNTQPAIATAENIVQYKQDILQAHKNCPHTKHVPFTPLMTCKLYETHSPQDINAIADVGATACKLYPRGVTTNAEDGIADVSKLANVYKAMEDRGLVLCIHGEHPDSFVLDREARFLEEVKKIQNIAPRLKIVLEHLTSAKAVEFVKNDTSQKLSGSITVHHLLYTLDDLIGDHLNPHLFCKPVLKYPTDRQALQEVVLQGNPKFFLGTDSAPHIKNKKECARGCAGVYSSPVALPLLVDFFETHKSEITQKNGGDTVKKMSENPEWIVALEKFVSVFGADFYELTKNTSTIKIEGIQWRVPSIVDDVVPLHAGDTLHWKIERFK